MLVLNLLQLHFLFFSTEKTDVIFTYSVSWKESEVKWASRWDTYLRMSDVQIHWFSIINSVVVVFFLSGMEFWITYALDTLYIALDKVLFQQKIIYVLLLDENICCGCSLEAPMFLSRNKKNNHLIPTLIWGWSGGAKVSCILCHRGVQLISAFSWARPSARWPRWLSWMCRPTGDQEVAGSTPAEVGNILLWRLIMKYFLWSVSPFR